MIKVVCAWQVTAGIIVGNPPDPRYTREFQITGKEWKDKRDERASLFVTRAGEACEYAKSLQVCAANRREPLWVDLRFVWM